MDTNNYPAERKTAYKRVARLMEDLMIPIPQRSLFAIEESLGQLELTDLKQQLVLHGWLPERRFYPQLLAHTLTGSTKEKRPKGAILNTREKHL